MTDTSDICFEVCDLKAEDFNPLTDLEELRRFLKLKCGVVRMFGEGMTNIQSIVDGWLVKLETDGIVNFSHAKLEREMMSLRDWDRLLSEHALMDTKIFSRIKKAVKRYNDDEKDLVILRNYKKQYKDARMLFDREVEKVELIKEKYHKKAFEAEKVEIKRELAEKKDVKKKYGDMLDELTKKTEGKILKYFDKFNKVVDVGQSLKEASNKYGAAKFQVDKKRAAFVIEKLQEYGQNVTLKMDGAEEADFSGIRIDEIVKNKQPMEQITVKQMEIYKGTKNKEALFKQVREEMQTEKRNVKLQSNDSVGEPKNSVSHVSPLSPTSDIELGKKYLIITAYKKLRPNQLSLAQGKTVKLLMPPNDDGYAFGEIKGKFGSKKKGYFPINNVITKK